jgi:hypothetical protein
MRFGAIFINVRNKIESINRVAAVSALCILVSEG